MVFFVRAADDYCGGIEMLRGWSGSVAKLATSRARRGWSSGCCVSSVCVCGLVGIPIKPAVDTFETDPESILLSNGRLTATAVAAGQWRPSEARPVVLVFALSMGGRPAELPLLLQSPGIDPGCRGVSN